MPHRRDIRPADWLVTTQALSRVRLATEFLSRSENKIPRPKHFASLAADVRQARTTAGNCAQWTSSGIEFAGLIPRTRLFPKSILVDLLESEIRHGRSKNAHVVLYKHVAHAPPDSPKFRFLRPAYAHPLSWVRNAVYSNMDAFADAVVVVPDGETRAVVERRRSPRRPPPYLPLLRTATMAGPALVLVGAVDHIGPVGPVCAAVWLGLSWWLY